MKKHIHDPSHDTEAQITEVTPSDLFDPDLELSESGEAVSSTDLSSNIETSTDPIDPNIESIAKTDALDNEEESVTAVDAIPQEEPPIEPEGAIIHLLDEPRKKTRAKGKKETVSRLQGRITRQKIVHVIATAIFMMIALAFAILALTPIVLTILNSFMSTKEIVTNYSAIFSSLSSNMSQQKTYLATEAHLKLIPDMVSIEQYATVLFKSPMYIQKFWNSIFLVVPIVAFQMITGSLAAYSFARYRRKRREVLYFIYIILMLMPFQVTLVPNYLIADKLGILDTVQAIILPGVFSTFSVFLLTKYMRRIPSSYIEAAKLDGAGDWHIFTRICIPMCKSALYAMAILLFIDYWNMVEQPLILLPDPEKQPLSVFLAEINSGEVGIAFAASFIFMVPPLLLFLNGEQYLVEGISQSGLK
jgi:multiple sugar transport system permease protein